MYLYHEDIINESKIKEYNIFLLDNICFQIPTMLMCNNSVLQSRLPESISTLRYAITSAILSDCLYIHLYLQKNSAYSSLTMYKLLYLLVASCGRISQGNDSKDCDCVASGRTCERQPSAQDDVDSLDMFTLVRIILEPSLLASHDFRWRW